MRNFVFGVGLVLASLSNNTSTDDPVFAGDPGIDSPVWINGAY